MALSELSIRDFRNLASIDLKPLTEGFNLLYGLNGSGKTSLLEAIYYLGHRRSFKSLSTEPLIRHSSELFSLFSTISDQFSASVPLGIERAQSGSFRMRLKGEELSSVSELARFLPMRLINVHSHYLLEGSPSFRRQFLDWGIFYQNPQFQPLWFRFKRLLKQRNAALRERRPSKELSTWTKEFAEVALNFHHLRLHYLEQFLPLFQSILDEGLRSFFDLSELSINYRPGWDLEQSYEEVLAANLFKDLERGHTHYGPHRADLSLKIKQLPAKELLSTGQQKLLVCGMILAQGALLAGLVNKPPIYLIDDLPAELDSQSRHWLISTLAKQQAQIFVTAVEQEAMSPMLAQIGCPVKMFHVKQGEITEV